MDVHQVTVSVAVRDDAGKLVMESTIETKATTILDFIRGVRGSVWVTFEEGASARLVKILKRRGNNNIEAGRRGAVGNGHLGDAFSTLG